MSKELILMSDVPGLGIEGDVVNVAEGYARNYLLPKQLAAPVTALTDRQREARRLVREERLQTEQAAAEKLRDRLADVSITLPMKAGPEGKLFGSVAGADIAQGLAAQDIEIDRHAVRLKEPLKELGVFDVRIKLPADIETTVKVWIVEE